MPFLGIEAINLTRRELLTTTLPGIAAAAIAPILSSHKAKASTLNSSASSLQMFALTMNLQVPRIYDNNESLGYRKYQMQKITAKIGLDVAANGEVISVMFYDMTNKTHRLSTGKNVTYTASLDEDGYFPRFNAIGSNKTHSYKTASICFSIAAEPSYNIGPFDEDTSLYVTLAGKGSIDSKGVLKRANGYVSGTLGCGCRAYGHISPTRKIGKDGITDMIDDVAAVYGTWSMRRLA